MNRRGARRPAVRRLKPYLLSAQTVTACVCAAAVCLAAAAPPAAAAPTPPLFPWYNTSLPTAQRVAALVAAMETSEKPPQLSVAAPALPRLNVTAYHWRSNVVHGTVSNGVATVFPQAVGLGATWDKALLHAVGRAISDEQRAKHNGAVAASPDGASPMDYGVNVWGPNINLFVKPQWGRGQETYGEDPTLTGALAAAFVTGLQVGPVPGVMQLLATLKHWDAYDVDKEPPRLHFMPHISETDLRQYYFPAFEAALKDANASAVMCAYSGINTTLDAPGEPPLSTATPMCASPLTQRVLRQELGFDGVVVTDSGALSFMVSEYHRFNATYLAAAAAMQSGVDLNSGTVYADDLGRALQDGLVTEAQLDVALTRLFTARMQAGLFDPPTAYDALNASVVDSAAHRALSQRAAEASFVLLKNTDNLLPLDVSKLSRVAVVGPAANDTYRLAGNYQPCTYGSWQPLLPACNFSTPLAAMQATLGAGHGVDVVYAEGCAQESSDRSGFPAAVAAARVSDVVVAFMGLRNCQGGQGDGGAHCISEGHDRPDLELPGEQTALLQALHATGKPVVLVLMDGGPVSINWSAANLPAILETFYAGDMAGDAIVNVLTGGVSPSGRLPYTMYTGMDQVPTELQSGLADPPGRTYRYLTSKPLYAFGFGLGYSPVAVSSAVVTPPSLPAATPMYPPPNVTMCGDVSNTGTTHAQDVVVQVFASLTAPAQPLGGRANVPRWALVGFARSGVLAPGDTAWVCVPVDVRALRLVDAAGVYGLHGGYSYALSFGTVKPGSPGTAVRNGTVQDPIEMPFTVEKDA